MDKVPHDRQSDKGMQTPQNVVGIVPALIRKIKSHGDLNVDDAGYAHQKVKKETSEMVTFNKLCKLHIQ